VLGPALFAGGLMANAGVAAALDLLALALLLAFVRE
jgi:hypothetical protein